MNNAIDYWLAYDLGQPVFKNGQLNFYEYL